MLGKGGPKLWSWQDPMLTPTEALGKGLRQRLLTMVQAVHKECQATTESLPSLGLRD